MGGTELRFKGGDCLVTGAKLGGEVGDGIGELTHCGAIGRHGSGHICECFGGCFVFSLEVIVGLEGCVGTMISF